METSPGIIIFFCLIKAQHILDMNDPKLCSIYLYGSYYYSYVSFYTDYFASCLNILYVLCPVKQFDLLWYWNV